jgi:opacity protein-like surface antigen
MRIVLMVVALLLLFPAAAAAQQTPAADVFGGYSYLRVRPGDGIDGFNLNGWNASVAVHGNSWFAVVGDFSGHYGNPLLPVDDTNGNGDLEGSVFIEPQIGSNGDIKVKTRVYSYLFGPRFTARPGDRAEVFFHALFGGARASFSVNGFSESDNAFAMAVGGGVDVRASDHVAFRLFQADYLLTRFGIDGDKANQHNFRISTGIVIRFGNR